MVMLALGAGCAEDSGSGVVDVDAGSDTGPGGTDLGPADTGPRDVGPLDAPPDDRAQGPCAADNDCAATPATPVCDVASGRCVGCRTAPDSCPPDQHCDGASSRCLAGCRADEGCATPDAGSSRLRCDTSTHSCVQCVTDEHCPTGNLCVGSLCVMGCTDNRGCPGGQTCCGGACVDTSANLAHCGACNTRCNATNATPACRNSTCAVGACTVPYGDCDAMASNGCETNTFTDVAHCGACARPCASRPNATAACNAGACAYTCAMGFADCDGAPGNGCETDIASSPMHCGACGGLCMPPRGTGVCMAGRCTVTACAPGYGDCNTNAADGCETNTSNTTDHCGACGTVCPSATNAAAACVGGGCVTFCVTGFLDCDGLDTTGCEVNVRTDLANCGACGRACTTANATPACTMSQCTIARCNTGFADCDGAAANGCEVNTGSNVQHCGGCGMRCPVGPNQIATCAGAACGLACAPTYVDLDNNPSNGCECRSTDPDPPDDSFADTNCDGIDGDASRAIFVATSGNDSNPGTRTSPLRTVQAGIDAAASRRFGVYIAGGTYPGSITLSPGVSLYGGYNATTWSRSASTVTTIQGDSPTAVFGRVNEALELQRLTITSVNATTAGQSSYGVRIAGSGAQVTLRRCTVRPGRGADGSPGTGGSVGAGGGNASGRTGGSSSCGATGGTGGAGVSGVRDGNPGTEGGTAQGGAGGGGGSAGGGCGNSREGANAPNSAAPGRPGPGGASGTAAGAVGTVSSSDGTYVPTAGGGGATGQPGGGGGGGGAGGGDAEYTGFFNCTNRTSGNGGGGGGGGCGGTGGAGGQSAGGSFAVMAHASVVRLENCVLAAGAGGVGGRGGNGGGGGGFGAGGTHTDGASVAGDGADGRPGATGGTGGGGAGGAGGPSVCVYYVGTAPTQTGVTCTRGGGGAGGAGGSGGSGTAPGGPTGISVDTRGG